MPPPPSPLFVKRVQIQNFRSIANCDVQLGPLMFIVGRNGSGKSNFLDALRFIADGLRDGLGNALDRRGGFGEVRRRSKTSPYDLWIRLEMELGDGSQAEYSATLGSRGARGEQVAVKSENCVIRRGGSCSEFSVAAGKVSRLKDAPAASPDRLYLVNASGLPAFRQVYDELSAMAFYNLAPASMREPVKVDGRPRLVRDGRNIGAMIGRMGKNAPGRLRRIEEYLARILPGLKSVKRKFVAGFETVEFRQDDWSFGAEQMSDGTLRATGVLTAVLGGKDAPLIGIEEPEIALHPAAFGVLRDALREGADSAQVLVTSQSPDLLDDPDLQPEQLLSVVWRDGQTKIGPVSEAEHGMLRDQLVTAGELLRQGRLELSLEDSMHS